MGNLDGSDKITPTPFDAHEQVVRGQHEHIPIKDASIKAQEDSGYKPAEYEHQEYPKAIAHDETTGEPIVAKDEEHEQELKEARD